MLFVSLLKKNRLLSVSVEDCVSSSPFVTENKSGDVKVAIEGFPCFVPVEILKPGPLVGFVDISCETEESFA